MVAGAIAYLIFAVAVSFVEMRLKPKVLVATAALLPLWAVVATVL